MAAAAAAAVNLCHNPPAQLPPSIVSETDITTETVPAVKRELDNDDERLLVRFQYFYQKTVNDLNSFCFFERRFFLFYGHKYEFIKHHSFLVVLIYFTYFL